MQDLKKTLQRQIELPVHLGPKYVRPLEYVELRRPQYTHEDGIREHIRPNLHALLDYYRNVMGWLKANPSEDHLPQAMESLYIFPKKEASDPYNTINLKENVDRFLKFLEDQKFLGKVAYIVGKKGIGKTYFLNYILNCYSDRLQKKDEGIVWYRVDGSKAYQYKLSALQCLYMQVLWVTLKYPHSNKYLQNPLAMIDQLAQHVPPTRRGVPDKRLVHDLVQNHLWLVQKAKSVKTILQTCDSRKVETLARAILGYLKAKGVTLVFIFDGIDNIDYYHGRRRYEQFLNDMIKSIGIGSEKPAIYEAKIVITLRNETFAHIRQRASTYAAPHVFVIKPLQVEDIVETKLSRAIDNVPEYFRSLRERGCLAINEDAEFLDRGLSHEIFDRDLKEFAKGALEIIYSELRRYGTPKMPRRDELLLVMYNENVRAFINNILNAFEYKLLFEEKKGLIDRDYIVAEGLFLDGRLFVNSEDPGDLHTRQEAFMNIFYYSSAARSVVWHGLCGVRLLTLLKEIGPYTREELAGELEGIFGYKTEIVLEFLSRFLEGGLIGAKYREGEGVSYYVLPKGEFLLNYSLSDINHLYYLALDTPLSFQLLERSNCVSIHQKYWRDYTECAIKTVITMMRHIITQNSREVQELAIRKERETSIEQKRLCELLVSRGVRFGNVIDQMVSMIETLSPSDRKERLIRDIEGLIEV